MLRNLRSNLKETILALGILGVSSYFSVYYFHKLFPEVGSERPSQFSALNLSHSFILYHKSSAQPHSDSCLGHFAGRFIRDLDKTEYSLRGEIYLKVADKSLPTNIEMAASFNILGQLGAAVLKVSNSLSSMTLGMLKINPIEVTFLSSSKSSPGDRKQFSIPGPVILKDLGSEFQIEYPAGGKSFAIHSGQFFKESVFNLQFKQVEDGGSDCSPEQRGELDILEITNKLNLKIPAFLSQTPLSKSAPDVGPLPK